MGKGMVMDVCFIRLLPVSLYCIVIFALLTRGTQYCHGEPANVGGHEPVGVSR